MTDNHKIPHIRIPRSLLEDPLWIDLSLKEQHVFHVFIQLASFKHRTFNDHGVIIDLTPGQLCTSERDFVKHCNKEVTRTNVQRIWVKLKLCGFCAKKCAIEKQY